MHICIIDSDSSHASLAYRLTMSFTLIVIAVLAASYGLLSATEAQGETAAQAASSLPLIIAHRGASGYRPEHTLAAYELAIDLGCDFIEPDLVPTKDGVLVARHENEISQTTDVAEHAEFANRRTRKIIDGKEVEGWFTEDFTLAELKTLRARERLPKIRQRNTLYNDRYAIPTFSEIIDLVKQKELQRGSRPGLYPELKHPSFFRSCGLDCVKALLISLAGANYTDKSSPIFVQCFELSTLRELRKASSIKLVLLIDDQGQPFDFVLNKDKRTYSDLTKPEALFELAAVVDGIGTNKNLLIPRTRNNRLSTSTSLVADAHKAGLVVHAWTFRNENEFLPADLRRQPSEPGFYGDAFSEYKAFFDLGVDGFFTENPDTAIEARTNFTQSETRR